MSGILLLQILVWVSYVFIAGIYTSRVIKYARMPVHLRWELYPVPHEEGREYGGSYFEELEWWTKPRRRSLIRDITFMIKDYLFLVQYFARNRAYWFVLYVWHISFYLMIGFHVLIACGALALITGLTVSAESASILGRMLHYLPLVTGIGAFTLGCIGSIGMLIRRLTDADLKRFATPRHYFSYVFYFGMFLSGLVAWIFFDPDFSGYREFYRSVATFSAMDLDPASVVHAVFFALFLLYMPLTPALHYATKFFMFFAVRWNDDPNFRGSKLEARIQKLLGQRVSWAASHIQTGKKWSEVATSLPASDGGETDEAKNRSQTR